MTLVSELELPVFDYSDPSMRGERFHAAMNELRAQGWLAEGPFGYISARPRVGRVLPAHALGDLPGDEDRRDLRGQRGAAVRADAAQHPACQRPRPHAAAKPREPGAVGARGGALPAGDEGVPRGLYAQAVASGRPGGANGASADGQAISCEFVEAFAKPYPSLTIATVMGAPLEDAPRLHHWSNWIQRQFDAASMASEREQIEQAVEEFYEYARTLVRRPAQRARRRSDLEADRGRGAGRPAGRAGVHQPRVQRARRRRGHEPEPAGAHDQAAGRTPRAVGAARRRTRRSRGGRSRRRCDTSRSRPSPRGS